MNNPFFVVANRVLKECAERNEKTKPTGVEIEPEWVIERLLDLAYTAYFVGEFITGAKIEEAANRWKQHGRKPAIFTEDVSA